MNFRAIRNIRNEQNIREEQDPTIQSQYSASQRIISLVESSRIRILPDTDILLFYEKIFNIETAEGVGLDIWGRILGMSRYLTENEQDDWFGFNEADFEPFNQSPFWNGQRNEKTYLLNDAEYRSLLMWKALANISIASASSLNILLREMFENKDIFIQEEYAPSVSGNGLVRICAPMEIRLYIFFELNTFQRAVLEQYGLFAKGAGVGFKYIEIQEPCFGFSEAGYEPFGQGVFWNGGYVQWPVIA